MRPQGVTDEPVVESSVVVPVLTGGGLEAHGELESLADAQGVRVQGERELVREAVAGVGDVPCLQVGETVPVVDGVADVYALVEVHVLDPHQTSDGEQRHVADDGVLQTHVSRHNPVQEVGLDARLLEHRSQHFLYLRDDDCECVI